VSESQDEFAIPKSGLWIDFHWPAWVPQSERDLIEKFWSQSNGRGPSDWLKNGALELRHIGVSNGDVVRAWELYNKKLVAGRILHRWNNIFSVIDTDGNRHMFSRIATDAAIEERREELKRKRAELDEQLAALSEVKS
jgi:hypothetical protein